MAGRSRRRRRAPRASRRRRKATWPRHIARACPGRRRASASAAGGRRGRRGVVDDARGGEAFPPRVARPRPSPRSAPSRAIRTRSSSPHPPRTETARLCVSGPTDASLESHRRSPPPSLDAREDSLSSEASPPCPSASPESAATSTRSSAAASSSAAAACTSGSGCAVASSTAAAARGPTAAASKKVVRGSERGFPHDHRGGSKSARPLGGVGGTLHRGLRRSKRVYRRARRSELGESSLACRRIARRAAVSTSRVPHADAAATAATCASTSLDATPRARIVSNEENNERDEHHLRRVAARGVRFRPTRHVRDPIGIRARRVTDDRDGFGSVSAAAMAGASAAERRHVSAVAAAGARSSARENSNRPSPRACRAPTTRNEAPRRAR